MKKYIKGLGGTIPLVKQVLGRINRVKKADENLPKKDSYIQNQLSYAMHPEKQYLVIDKIIEHSEDVKTFIFKADVEKGTKSLAFFNAGQYLSLTIKIGNFTITRPYSICSAPKEALDGQYRLTIKRVKGGLATNYILDNFKEGDKITASGPEGTFTYEPLRDAKTIIGLAGGSGITPFLSLAHAIADGDEDANLILLYGSRTQSDILFRDEFDEIANSCDKVKVVYVLSDESVEGLEKGFLTADLIKKYAPEEEDYSLFMCGPQAMYNFLDKEIEKLEIRKKFVRHEVFGEFHNPGNEADYVKPENDMVNITVDIKGEKTTFSGHINNTILASIEAQGIQAPAKCRSGICGWCHSRLISGDVYVPKTVDGRRLADLDFGYIHPCCTFPLSDIEIEIYPEA